MCSLSCREENAYTLEEEKSGTRSDKHGGHFAQFVCVHYSSSSYSKNSERDGALAIVCIVVVVVVAAAAVVLVLGLHGRISGIYHAESLYHYYDVDLIIIIIIIL